MTIYKKEVETRIKGLPVEVQRKIVCALVGHSMIVSVCLGYISCGRCDEQIGDILGGSFNLKECVILKHDCEDCAKNYSKLGWKDLFMVPIENLFGGKNE